MAMKPMLFDCDDTTKARLTTLAKEYGLTNAAMLRRLINQEYLKDCKESDNSQRFAGVYPQGSE